ncbi:M61 family metallopeptidase [Alteromonas pelagimontana]|nr:PDZ domain-containing protein [Alteromonas pelagimontana]
MTTEMSSVSYSVSVISQADHLFGITMAIPALPDSSLVLSVPSWIPGSYMIREFARNVVALSAVGENEEALEVVKLDKQRWQVKSDSQAVTVTYQVYAFDLSVRSAYLSDEYGFFNGTSLFLAVDGHTDLRCEVAIRPPQNQPDWQVYTAMTEAPSNSQGHYCYTCEDYDEAIDHPVFIGNCTTTSITVDGVEFVLLFSGSTGTDLARIGEDLKPICAHHLKLFSKPAPISRYLFITLLSDTGFGGLEHRSSTALLYPRFDLPQVGESSNKTDGYITFLSLCSHELFHTWHVKRIKPDVMVTPDLSAEVYTDQLWIYEGFTSFYDDLALVRVGTISPEKYLEILGQNLTRLQQTPGRLKQSAAASSFDAWTRFYKQDASSVNHIVSYYLKGGIIALGLDLLLRQESKGQYSLDSVMQILWDQYGKDESGTPDEIIADICREHFDIDVSGYLEKVTYGTDDVPLENWLPSVGVSLHYRVKQGASDKGGTPPNASAPKRQLGATLKAAETGVTVTQVKEGLAASEAGLQVNDRIIALEGWQATDGLLHRLLEATDKPALSLSVLREGRLITLSLPVRAAHKDVCYLTIYDKTKVQKWLGL